MRAEEASRHSRTALDLARRLVPQQTGQISRWIAGQLRRALRVAHSGQVTATACHTGPEASIERANDSQPSRHVVTAVSDEDSVSSRRQEPPGGDSV